jgi:CheY-like chemotaxis protein
MATFPINALPFPTFLLNRAGLVVESNELAAVLYGGTTGELSERPLPGFDDRMTAAIVKDIETSGPQGCIRTVNLSGPSGVSVPVLWAIARLDADASSAAWACALALPPMDRTVPGAEWHERRRFRIVRRLLGRLYHDLGNILAPIAGWTAGLQRDVTEHASRSSTGEADTAYILGASKQIHTAARAALDVLESVRRAKGEVARFRSRVTMDDAVATLVQTRNFRPGFVIDLSLNAANVVAYLTDPDDLDELIGHALVAIDDQVSSIVVTIATGVLEDTAIGAASLGGVEIIFSSTTKIPISLDAREILQRIPPRFPETWAKFAPTLASSGVRAIAEDNGGYVNVTSDQRTLQVVLPRYRTILALDDNVWFSQAMKFEFAEYDWLSVGTVEEALRWIDDPRVRIDCLVTDCMLPDGNGVEMALHAAQIRPRLPVIVMSGMVLRPEEAAIVERIGANSLYKPFLWSDLRAILNALGVTA